MSAFKGTPGPWEARERRGYVIVRGANGAGVFIEDVTQPGATEDARLISAAPELLALAERVSRLNPNAGEIGAGMLAQLVDEAQRIVAKATGEQP